MRALAESMGIEVSLDDGVVVGRMPVAGNTQPYGILHGGATAVLVESVGSIAAACHAQEALDGDRTERVAPPQRVGRLRDD
ncbi:MAG: hypothetical protein R2687_01050 [Candidatus Nanopelagicales bacterium]